MDLQKTIQNILAFITYYDKAMTKIEKQRGLYPEDPDENIIFTL